MIEYFQEHEIAAPNEVAYLEIRLGTCQALELTDRGYDVFAVFLDGEINGEPWREHLGNYVNIGEARDMCARAYPGIDVVSALLRPKARRSASEGTEESDAEQFGMRHGEAEGLAS